MNPTSDPDRPGRDQDVIRQLQLENQMLAERAEEIFLLGKISAEVASADTPRKLLARGLEKIALLREIPFAGYGRWSDAGLDLEFGYNLNGENVVEGRVLLDPRIREKAHRQMVVLRGDETVRFDPPVGGNSQAGTVLIPAPGARPGRGCFVFAGDGFADDNQEGVQLLNRAVEIMSMRLDLLDSLEQLSRLNRELDAEVVSRTRQLQQAQKMEILGRLAGGIAHDFNNVLMAMVGHAELALLDMQPGSAAREDLQAVLAAGARGSRLTRQLLSFSRQQVFSREPLDLNEVIGELATVWARTLGENIALELDLPSPACLILADKGQIEQVFMNLVLNARDAMPGGGRIRVSIRSVREAPPDSAAPVGPHVAIEIADQGEGMAPEIRDRIFDPFFTTKEVGKGTGLGLAMVQNICRGHDGWVEVESEPGQGAVFTLHFPEFTGEVAASPEVSEGDTPTGTETVLLVEDDPSARRVMDLMLGKLGYKTVVADSGDAALLHLEDGDLHLDLLLSDVVMPGMSGGELGRRARTLRPDLRILFITGYIDDEIDVAELRKVGDGLLFKPVSMDKLATGLREVLAGSAGSGG